MSVPECIDRARIQQPELNVMPIIPPNTVHPGDVMNSDSVPIRYLLECPDCENGTCDSCPLHHIWKAMPSQPAVGLDKPSMRFTSVPIPAHWRVQKSIIPGAGLGLFARTHIPCGTRMGPYRGVRRVLSRRAAPDRDMCYAWEIKKNGKVVEIVDGKDPKKSNFMRYINCACYETQQNMVAYQYKGEIYYRSVKDIEVGEELLVWYGHEYGKELGLLNTSLTMSLGPLKKHIGRPPKQNPVKNDLKGGGGSVAQQKKHSQRGRPRKVPVNEADCSKDLDVNPLSLLQHPSASSPTRGVGAVVSPDQDSVVQGLKRPAPSQSSVTPPKKKKTKPTRSPPVTNQETSKITDQNDTHSSPKRKSLRLSQNPKPTYFPSPVKLEDPVSARNKRTSPPNSAITDKKLAASDNRQPKAIANKKSRASSPLENSINVILSSSTEGNRLPMRHATRSRSTVPMQGSSSGWGRKCSKPRTIHSPPTQHHSETSTPLVDRSHPVAQELTSPTSIPSSQSTRTPPSTESTSPRAVATSNHLSPPLSQAHPSTSVTASPSSRSKKSTIPSVATATTDFVVPRSRIKQETVSTTEPSSVTMDRLKQEVVAPGGNPHCSSPCQLVVDNIHNCDLFLIIRPQDGAPSPATSYYCRVCNGRLILTDTGHLAHSSTPLVSCNSASSGTVKKSLKIPCVFCDSLLSSRGALYHHIKTSHRHKLSNKPYYCSICQKWYETSMRLWRHLRIHLDVGPPRGKAIKHALVQKRAVHQPPSLGRSEPQGPFLAAPADAHMELACSSEVSLSDTEIVSVGSQEFAPCDEIAEEPLFPPEDVGRELRSKKRLEQSTQVLRHSPLKEFSSS